MSSSDEAAVRVAQKALASAAPIPPHNAFADHNRHVLAELAKRGLPTRADGVRVFVMGENSHGKEADHGLEMVRTIAGKAGLAQGADIRMYETKPEPDDDGPHARTTAELISSSVENVLWVPNDTADLVRRAMRQSPNDGKPTLVAISVGASVNDEAESAADATIKAPPQSALAKSARKVLGHAPRPDDYDQLLSYYQSKIMAKMREPDNVARMAKAEGALTKTLQEARGRGVLVFLAAGNSRETEAPNPAGSSKDAANAHGLISVGAVDPATGRLASWSGEGAEVALPGVAVPVGPARKNGLASTVEGTSFSGPDAVGLAALMVAAGARDVDQIERILKSPNVSHHVGKTPATSTVVPDEVAAVAAIKSP